MAENGRIFKSNVISAESLKRLPRRPASTACPTQTATESASTEGMQTVTSKKIVLRLIEFFKQ
jgi:hypothetical protein